MVSGPAGGLSIRPSTTILRLDHTHKTSCDVLCSVPGRTSPLSFLLCRIRPPRIMANQVATIIHVIMGIFLVQYATSFTTRPFLCRATFGWPRTSSNTFLQKSSWPRTVGSTALFSESSAQQTDAELAPLYKYEGLFAVEKPLDWTSNDVVSYIRGILERDARNRGAKPVNIRSRRNKSRKFKVGHGGTLDPLASGVLVIGVGKGTKELQQ